MKAEYGHKQITNIKTGYISCTCGFADYCEQGCLKQETEFDEKLKLRRKPSGNKKVNGSKRVSRKNDRTD